MSRSRSFDGAYEVGDLALIVLAQDGVVRVTALALEGPLGTATIDDAAAVTALFLRVLERVRG